VKNRVVADDPNSPFNIQLDSHIIQKPQDVREFHCETQPRKRTNHERLEELESHQLGSNFSLPTLSKQNITTNVAHQNDNRLQGLSHKQMKLGNILNTRPDLHTHAMIDIRGGQNSDPSRHNSGMSRVEQASQGVKGHQDLS
jgi:hypothetical protein